MISPEPLHARLVADHFSQNIHKGAQLVAVKRLNHPLDYLRERHASALASAVSHPHVVPLLFSYSQLMENHLVFPWAGLNLEEYWESNKVYLIESRTIMEYPLVLWVAQQCEGLVDALRHVQHSLVGSSEDRNGALAADGLAVHAYHVDIKPTNILAFFRPGEELPVLQLTGFGSTTHATIHEHTRLPTDGGNSAEDYVAPEVFFREPASDKSDIWSLGCVFLDFVEWLMPIVSSEGVPRRMLTEYDETLEPLVEGREAWRDWRRSYVGNGEVGVAAFYFEASSGELSEWIYTVSMLLCLAGISRDVWTCVDLC